MQSGDLSLELTAESQMRELKQQKARSDKTEEKRRAKEIGEWPDPSTKSKRGKKKLIAAAGLRDANPNSELRPDSGHDDDDLASAGHFEGEDSFTFD